MALIKCGECGKEVSDKAVSCPGCGVPIAGPRSGEKTPGDREEVLKEMGVQEVIVRDRLGVEFEILGRHIKKYFPVLVAVFASLYIPYRIAMELGMGDDLETMPDWIGITGMGIAIAALIFGKFIRGRIGWAAAIIFVAWFILSPDFVSRGEQANLDDSAVIRNLQQSARQVYSCKTRTALIRQQGNANTASFNTLVEQCDEHEKKFLDLVAGSTDKQLNSICAADFRTNVGAVVDAACTSRNL